MNDISQFNVEIDAHVAWLILNRPEKRNAVDSDIMSGLLAAIEQITADKSARVVVLSGEGKGFCAGLDMASFGDMVSGDLTADSAASAYDDLSPSGANRVQQLGWAWQELGIPVIAAIHGGAMGGGLNLALGADIRVVAPDAKLGFVEITFGLLPDMSATQSLRHLARLDRIKELIFTGEMIDAEEACRIGLVNRVVAKESLMEEARSLAMKMCDKSSSAIRLAKEAIDNGLEMDFARGSRYEADLFALCFATEDCKEGISAFLEKRAAKF